MIVLEYDVLATDIAADGKHLVAHGQLLIVERFGLGPASELRRRGLDLRGRGRRRRGRCPAAAWCTARARRSPAPRWLLLLVACALYGSTGWLKATMEPAWWTGEALELF